jgi:cytochrome P450
MGSSRSLDKPKTPISRMKVQSVLDDILREADFENRGITNVATTEISLLLWMMMDAGHAWTFMALNLLSKQEEACQTVQAEVDRLELTYGKERLFTSFVLGKMEKLDNLIYEAIRLSPQFLGALKVLSQTVEVDGCQIPKNSNVIFCNPHEHDTFTLDYSSPRRPEEMGMVYPSVEL